MLFKHLIVKEIINLHHNCNLMQGNYTKITVSNLKLALILLYCRIMIREHVINSQIQNGCVLSYLTIRSIFLKLDINYSKNSNNQKFEFF